MEEGLKPEGLILINTDRDPRDLGLKTSWAYTTSAEALARRILGRPIINTALLGTFACLSKQLSLESVLKAVHNKFPGELGEKNGQVVQESYRQFLKEAS